MNNNKFETGATTHAVNELILFVDTTRNLAEKRDEIYKMATEPGIYMAELNVNGPIAAKNTLAKMFTSVLIKAINQYKIECPEDNLHIVNIKQWDDQGQEFCKIYAARFENWKLENRIKQLLFIKRDRRVG